MSLQLPYYPKLRQSLSAKGIGMSASAFKMLLKALKSADKKSLHSVLNEAIQIEEKILEAVPLDTLFARLYFNGIQIDPGTVLDIQRILATPALVPKKLENFGTVLKPLICKSVSQLTIFDKAFDEYLEEVRCTKGDSEIDDDLLQEIHDAFDEDRRQRKRATQVAAAVSVLLAVGMAVGIRIYTREIPHQIELNADIVYPTSDTARGYFVEGDSVRLRSTILPSGEMPDEDEKVVWFAADDTVQGQQVTIKLNRGQLKAKALLYQNDAVISVDSTNIYPECERLPAVRITRLTSNTLAEPIRYRAVVSNPSADSSKYKYSWKINSKEVNHTSEFEKTFFSPTTLSLTVVVNYPKGLHCSTDSLITELEETIGEIPTSISGVGDIAFVNSTKKNLAALIIASLLIFSFCAYYWVSQVWRRKTTIDGISDDGQEPPYSLKLKKQSPIIQVEKSITERTVNFNRRQISEETALDLQKTILGTASAGGFPTMMYRLVPKKQSFVFLIDSAIVIGHRSALVDFLIEFFTRNQVEVFCFHFYRTLYELSSFSPRRDNLSIRDVGKNHPQSSVVIFSTADHFFPVDQNTPYDWVFRTKEIWDSKTLVTFTYGTDFGFRKTLLEAEEFTVVPFDLDTITKTLFHELDEYEVRKFRHPFKTELHDIDSLHIFLGNGPLKQWVFALSVYPKPDWDVTLAIGSALERAFPEWGSLLTYDNLEKLSHIEWLNDGVLSDDLRAAMLKGLDTGVHKIARETLHELLSQIKPNITPASAVWNEYKILKAVNEFTLKGLEDNLGYVKDNLSKIQYLRETGNLDTAAEKNITEDMPAYKTAARNAKWQTFPNGYLYRLTFPLLLSALLVLTGANVDRLKGFVSTQTSDVVRFIIRNQTNDDSLLQNPGLSITTESRKLNMSRLNDTLFVVRSLSRAEIFAAVDVRLNMRSGDSLAFYFDSLKKVNYLNLEISDKRIPVTVLYNDLGFRGQVNAFIETMTSSREFKFSTETKVDTTIQRTTIESDPSLFNDLARAIKSSNVFDTLIVKRTPYDTSQANLRKATIYLYYKGVPPPPRVVYTVRNMDSGSGVLVKEFKISGTLINTDMHVALIDQRTYKAEVVGKSDQQPEGIIPMKFAGEDKLTAVLLGSGFVESYSPLIPNGFLKIAGNVQSDVKRQGYNGIVGVRNDKLEFLPSTAAVRDLASGFQTGPFLVRDGRMVYNTRLRNANERYNRAFIGTNIDGKIVAAVTERPVSLIELARLLSSPDAPQDLRCVEALNLSGGGAETLIVRGNQALNKYGSAGEQYESALIRFFRETTVVTHPAVPKPNYEEIYNQVRWTGKGYQSDIIDNITVYVDSYTTTKLGRGVMFRVGWQKDMTETFTLNIGESKILTLGNEQYIVTIKLVSLKNSGINPNREANYNIKVERRKAVSVVAPGLRISNSTITCIARDRAGKTFLITADHAFNRVGEEVVFGDAKQTIGKVVSLSDFAAIIELNSDNVRYNGNALISGPNIVGIQSSPPLDEQVTFYSSPHGPSGGYIGAINVTAEIASTSGDVTLRNAISIRGAKVVGGDSGAPVLTSEGYLVGFVYASDASTTYVVPIQPVLDKYQLQLVYDKDAMGASQTR